MKKYFYIVWFSMLWVGLKSQINLVPNYSFEQYNMCPTGISSNIFYSINWNNSNTIGTSDYYNSCVLTNTTFGIPSNWCGNQLTKNGNAYAGFYAKTIPYTLGQYEYVQSQLMDSLKPNYHYCVQFYLSRADKKGDYAISNFGALFTKTQLNSSDPYNIQMNPQVKNQNGNYITNRTIWSSVSGTFTAVGGEKFISIGNFDDPNLTDTLYDPLLPDDFIRDPGSIYYYIDDVTVEEVANAQAGRDSIINCGDSLVLGADSAIGAYYKWIPSNGLSNDSIAFPVAHPTITTTYALQKTQCHIVTYDTVKVTVAGICPVGVHELVNTYKLKVYPTPTQNELIIECDLTNKQNVSISIYNMLGELVKKQNLQNGTSKIDVSDLKSGTYLYHISIDDNQVKKDKLIIIK